MNHDPYIVKFMNLPERMDKCKLYFSTHLTALTPRLMILITSNSSLVVGFPWEALNVKGIGPDPQCRVAHVISVRNMRSKGGP